MNGESPQTEVVNGTETCKDVSSNQGPAYTRRQYTGGVPNNRILRYHMGNRTVAEAKFEVVLNPTVDNSVQINTPLLRLRDDLKRHYPKRCLRDRYALRCTSIHTMSSGKTSRPPVPVQTGSHRG